MSHLITSEFWEELRRLYLEEDHGDSSDYDFEKPRIESALGTLLQTDKFKGIYSIDKPLGRGGAGLVICVKDSKLGLERALKIPRPKKDEEFDPVRTEMNYLNKLRHENVIPLYGMGDIDVDGFSQPYPYFVMEYVEGAQHLRKRLEALLAVPLENKRLREITSWVTEVFYKVGAALEFLHSHETIHFDVKPSNVLIAPGGRVFLSDLGLARRKDSDAEPIPIGFSLFYAHPDLRVDYQHMSSVNRVRRKWAPNDFRIAFDLYAFGRSLLEALSVIATKFPDSVQYDYLFLYLHLAACRMLDGRNIDQKETDRIKEVQERLGEPITVYNETCLQLGAPELSQISYKDLGQVRRDFEKVLVKRTFPDSVPELDPYFTKRVQSSEGCPAAFSKRVKRIVEHPVFSRLSNVPQLGLLTTVFPTARHTRLDHSVGTFRNCCLYVESLLNDPYNPLFRQVLEEEDLRCVLLASLLHDVGQYPLAHELGEISPDLEHEGLSREWLDNPTRDVDGNTIAEIIQNRDWGWGVDIESLKEVLASGKGSSKPEFSYQTLKPMLLSSLIDGPIDVDKLDYLLRDGRSCYLKYGELIDFDRLVRSLTVIISGPVPKGRRFVLGTYEKGQSAAESLAFARYLLYQSLYWHHTARAVRAMLREAFATFQKAKPRGRTFRQDLTRLLGVEGKPLDATVHNVLKLCEKWAVGSGKKLVIMVRNRNYYKRILTIHSEPSATAEGKPALLESFREGLLGSDFQEDLRAEIRGRFESFLAATSPDNRVSLLAPDVTNHTLEILSQPKAIICDCPKPVYGSNDALKFIPEPERLQKNYTSRAAAGERTSEVWHQVYYRLMNITSKGRVFCHPEIRGPLMAALGPDGVRAAVTKKLGIT